MQKPVARKIALHAAPKYVSPSVHATRPNFIYGNFSAARAAKVSGNYIIREQEAGRTGAPEKRGCRCKIRFDMEKSGAPARASSLSYFSATAFKRKTRAR